MRDAPGASAESRQRVLRAADELDYRPDTRARLLRSSRSRLIGVVFGVQHAFHGDLVTGLYGAAAVPATS
jgi:DNA-binding LacI/PurR family transcriptional regulator